jgi:hypothetical protein
MAVGIDRALADTGVGAANAAVHDVRGGSVRWLVLLLVLAAGWGALFSYSVVFLAEDLPLRPVSPRPGIGSAPEDTSTFELPPELMRTSGTAVQRRPEARAPEAVERPASRLMLAEASTAAAAPEAAPIRTAAIPAAAPLDRFDYIGTWGPTEAACGMRSRRRGYLPARITADGARAGRTFCSFHDRTRSGNAWVMAADCNDRGRRWTSQVRLLVEGDRLTWSSAKGSSSYLRCPRRAG